MDAYIAPIFAGKWLNGQFFWVGWQCRALSPFAAIASVTPGTFRPVDIINRFLSHPFDELDDIGMGKQLVGAVIVACKGGFIKQAVDHAMANAMQPFGFSAAL